MTKTTTTFKQDASTTNKKNTTISAMHHQSASPNQVPTPEPRTRNQPHTINNNNSHHPLTIGTMHQPTNQKMDDETKVINEQQDVTTQKGKARLVTVEQNPKPNHRKTPKSQQPTQIYCLNQKPTGFEDTLPVEFVTAQEIGSSMKNNNDYYDDEDVHDEYYPDEEEYETSEQADELTNLSRQSMMPLHELIAYYQYIQQGHHHQAQRETVSRQSSSASQKFTRTKHSLCDDTVDGGSLTNCDVIPEDYHADTAEVEEKKDLETSRQQEAVEPPATQIKVPVVRVENVDLDTNNIQSDGINAEEKVKISTNLNDKRRIRANVVLELINSERDFVKHLRDVVEGYLYPARKHPEIFTGERINTIFSNIEQLYEFQRKFLESLESCINWNDLADSLVGQCFLEYEHGFSVYHHYCNNHPNATSELQELYTKPRFVKFFEACRLLQNMIDISLDGFLLTPIQKICKYPLQLNELLKNTDEDHPDFNYVANALESMRNCANLANERKRRIEALADVMSFQEKVENWSGPKLSDTSSILIHSGEVSKMTSHTWSQGVQLYLFDHLLLLSKKDLLKRNSLILKGRICMDSVTEISDADEYKPKKSFKLYCSEQQRWFIFTTRSEKERDEWIKAFERERNLVETDENEGFHITEREIGVARRALQNRKHSRSARYRHKRPDTAIVDQLDIDDANTIMNRTLSLPSCIHPSHVLNFVEDSRVVSSRKAKNSSPSSSSRSPNASTQYLTEDQESQQQQQHQPHSTGGNWFKKMGSKKLARSQVYNINGGSSSRPNTNSPTAGGVIIIDASTRTTASPSILPKTVPTTTGTNYDQLEKRHRDHMVIEEQARLFRLNNDLPPPIFASSIPSTAMATKSSQSGSTSINQRQSVPNAPYRDQQRSTARESKATSLNSADMNFHYLNLNQDQRGSNNQSSGEHRSSVPKSAAPDEISSSFETTVVLSSGRVVRVREDAV